jgi:hypothetical protein
MKTSGWRLLVVAALLLQGCATDIAEKRMPHVAVPEIIPARVISGPLILAANVGEVMLTARDYSEIPTKSKLPVFYLEKREVKVKHKLKEFIFTLPSGQYRLIGTSDEGSFFAAPDRLEEARSRTGYGGLFLPKDSQVATEVFWQWSSRVESYRKFFAAPLPEPVPVVIGDVIYNLHSVAPEDTATLTYAGVAGGQIKFVYREYTAEGLARAAFTQEVSLDYKPGGEYAYKDARFTVQAADSTHIEYALIHGL